MRKNELQTISNLKSAYFTLQRDSMLKLKQYPSYNAKLEALGVKIKKLDELSLKMNPTVSSTTNLKYLYKQATIKSVLAISNGVKLYALMEGKKPLYKASCYSYSDLNRSEPELALARMQQILSTAKQIKNPQLFALSKEQIKEAEEKVKDLKQHINAPLLHIKNKARWAQESRKLISDIKKHIKTHLLPFFEILKNDKQYFIECFEFYNTMKMKKRGRPKGSVTKKVKQETSLMLPARQQVQEQRVAVTM